MMASTSSGMPLHQAPAQGLGFSLQSAPATAAAAAAKGLHAGLDGPPGTAPGSATGAARAVLTLLPKALPGRVGEAVLLLSRVGLPAVLGRDCTALAPLRDSVAGSGCTCRCGAGGQVPAVDL